MLIEIKRWDTGAVIHGGEFDSVRLCLEDGKTKRIDFYRANLRDANLSGANLSGVYLIDANLSGANLSGANLSGVYLIGANLSGVYLIDANLIDANLSGANLSGANLSGVYLIGANLSGVYLIDANGGGRISCLQHGKYRLVILDEICWGGCTKMTCDEWLAYDGASLDDYDKNYLETVTKPFIRMVMGEGK